MWKIFLVSCSACSSPRGCQGDRLWRNSRPTSLRVGSFGAPWQQTGFNEAIMVTAPTNIRILPSKSGIDLWCLIVGKHIQANSHGFMGDLSRASWMGEHPVYGRYDWYDWLIWLVKSNELPGVSGDFALYGLLWYTIGLASTMLHHHSLWKRCPPVDDVDALPIAILSTLNTTQENMITWWLIPLSKWVITLVINGISGVSPLITRVLTHSLSGMTTK